jgi:Secretion system C-terminal sorting domain
MLNDAIGRKVYFEKVSQISGKQQKEINVSKINPGIYTLMLTTNQKTWIEKVLIQ